MTTLMTYAGESAPHSPRTRTGGVPLLPPGTTWPTCSSCGGAMQFLAQIRLDDLPERFGPAARFVSVFMCQNDPGLCEEWDPAFGGNAALVSPVDGAVPAAVPAAGETLLGFRAAVEYVAADGVDYWRALGEWTARGGRRRDVLGQLGGEPGWLQGAETPSCPQCAEPMAFVAQLEEGHDGATSMNFGGGGSAYVFACDGCGRAAFLWQS